ncbi:MAG: hypothetical protein C4551_06680, partial [Bacillota bacterium]
ANSITCANLPTGWKLRVAENDTYKATEVGGTATVDLAGLTLPASKAEALDAADAVRRSFTSASDVWGEDALYLDRAVSVNIDSTTTPGDITLPLPVFDRASSAKKADGTDVAEDAGRFESGRVGSALTIEEATTNLLVNPGFEKGNLDGWTDGYGTRAASTASKRSGSYSVRLASSDARCGQTVTGATPGTVYTASAYLRLVTGTNIGLYMRFLRSDNSQISSYNVTHATSTWTRKTLTQTAPAGTAKVLVDARAPADATHESFADDIQLEAKAYVTSMCPAPADSTTQYTRAAETLTFPGALIDPEEGTFECNVYLDRAPGTQNQYILDAGGPTNRSLKVYIRASDSKLVTEYGTGSAVVTLVSTSTFAATTWYGVAVRWSAAGVKQFRNGSGEGSGASVPDIAFAERVYLGSAADGTLQLDGRLDDVRVSSTAHSDADILDDYTAGTALAVESDTLLKLPLDSDLSATGGRMVGTWTSPAIDLAAVADKDTGRVVRTLTAPSGTTVAIVTRASADNVVWGPWTALGAGNSIVSAAQRYLRVKVTLTTTAYSTVPSVSLLEVVYSATPTATEITDLLSTTARYCFVTQNDYLFIVNGEDGNMRWDGTTLTNQAGSPPICPYALVHKNMMFLAGSPANRSRLYFSEIGDPESWDALDYIDVGRGDGDAITGLAIVMDALVITKETSLWILQGDSGSNFVLRRMEENGGSVGQHTHTVVKQTVAMLGTDHIRFFNGIQAVNASEKIEVTVGGLNERILSRAAAVYWDNKYFLAVPDGSSSYNDLVLVFDVLRAAWTKYSGMDVGEWCIWRKQAETVLVFGSATTGQIYEMTEDYNDDGAAIDAYAVTKALDFGAAEAVKLVRSLYVVAAEGNGQTTNLSVSFFKDLSSSETSAATVSLGADLTVGQVIPSTVGISTVRTLQVKVRNGVLDRSAKIYALTQEYVPKGVRAT